MTTTEYNSCVDLYADRVYRFIIKHTRNEADANDVVQNAFEVLWKNVSKIEFKKARAYLFSVAYNNMVDGFRKMKRINHVETISEQAAVTRQTAPDLKSILNQGLSRLSDIQRSVVLLRDYEGYSYKEIAKMVDLTETQVKVYIFRARKKLKSYLVSMDYVI
ncbi:MAG: RNA polymerase sigma factor [Chitinophagales bacterium]